MRQIKARNTKPELVVRSLLHRLGYRFRLHDRKLPGCPDIVLRFQNWDAGSNQVFKGRIVESGGTSRVGRVASGNENHHALTGTGEEDAVRITKILLAVKFMYCCPLAASEGTVLPAAFGETEVSIPSDTDPVELEPLNLELRGGIF